MQLIKGTYSKEDALAIVEQIIRIKTKFHEEKISLSDSEEDIKMREARIKELQSDLAAFRKTLYTYSGAINMNALLNLNAPEPEPNSNQFNLINGNFEVGDAQEILLQAFNSKINFHKIKAWSKSERGEDGAEAHINRVRELEITAGKIKQFLQSNPQQQGRVIVTCSVAVQTESKHGSYISESGLVHSY